MSKALLTHAREMRGQVLIHHVVQKQKLAEGQEIAEAVLDAEVRLGELRKEIPKNAGGDHGNQYTGGKKEDSLAFATPKQRFDATVGFSSRTMDDIQKISTRPDIIERVKAEKREAGEIVTRQDVLNAIKAEEQASREPQAPQEPPWLHRRMFFYHREN